MAWQETIHADRIDPQVRPPKEPAAFSSAKAAFEAGNYPVALNMARDTEPELHAMALVLGGAVRRGLELLDEQETLSEQARTVRDYANWCLNKETILASHFSNDPGQPIGVLVITMPGSAKGAIYDRADGFDVRHLHLSPADFGSSIQTILNEQEHGFLPKLAVVVDCFGPYLPEGLFDAGFPVAVWVGDHDYFLPLRHADLSRAHILVTNSAAEHSELVRCYPGRVAAFPGHDTYTISTPAETPAQEFEWDLLFTGRAFVPYMKDKAQQLFRMAVAENQAARISIVDGYFPDSTFVHMLRKAKTVPLFWRYGGGLQTRAADKLRQGGAVLSPEQGLCREFLGAAGPSYRLIGTNFEADDLRASPDEPEANDSPTAAVDLFWSSPAREERFLKFCLFQSLLVEDSREVPQVSDHVPAEQRGYPPEFGLPVYTAVMSRNMTAHGSPAQFNAAGCAGFYGAILSQENQKLGQLSLDFFREGGERYPDHAALRFNSARALWVFGLRRDAVSLFEGIAREFATLAFDASTDALLSHRVRLLAGMFDYGDFYRLAVETLTDPDASGDVLKLLGSSAETYIASAAKEEGNIDAALAHLGEAIGLNSSHATPHVLRLECLDQLGGQDAEALEAFYRAVNLYPPILLSHARYGIRLEKELTRTDRAKEILNKYVLFFARTSDQAGKRLGDVEIFRTIVREHRSLLGGWIGELADKVSAEGN